MNRPNKLISETSPYLLQHAYNPVDWYSWGESAFSKAKNEDKPIFLSIGYSTCHWCHVMENESFIDNEVAKILNENFVSIKVDKEEKPDVDSVYMSVCQAFTGSGGWPMSIMMTPDQKPFFAGTYFPKYSRYGIMGFVDLLLAVSEKWKTNKEDLIKSSNEIIGALLNQEDIKKGDLSEEIIKSAVDIFKSTFDVNYGGFGVAPKFPTPHNLIFLLRYFSVRKDEKALFMVEKTLMQMYKGGIFDHIGFGFSRYSTDEYWLAPHFEKMLYDNALITIAYLEAYQITKNELYKSVAIKTMDYIIREMTDEKGGFYSAQDADSEGVEGKYYVFSPNEIISYLGEKDGEYFNNYFDITQKGNFEGKSIPNLIKNSNFDENIDKLLPKVYEYRKNRTSLHKDDKILTSWNSLMIVAFSKASKILGNSKYFEVAKRATQFIEENLVLNEQLFVGYRDGKRSEKGFLDDYAFYIWSQIEMYEASFDDIYLDRAMKLNNRALADFYDNQNSGFYLYGKDSEKLILRPKETYDGAIPSGNSVMAYNLIKLSKLTKNADLENLAQKQLEFISGHATNYPAGFSFFMMSLMFYLYPSKDIVCVLKDENDLVNLDFDFFQTIKQFKEPTEAYPLKNDKTTFYICEGNKCLPPRNREEL